MTEPSETPPPSTALVPADRVIPVAFAGKLEPNYYCRGWNEKRKKYCGARAGWGTDHPGEGRCKQHDGGASGRVIHGQRRRYLDLKAPRLRELVQRYADDPEPFNVRAELDLARALMVDWIERYETFTVALIAWYDSWEGKYVPISESESRALVATLDEYENLLAEEEATAKQRQNLDLARAAVTFLSMPREPKPRKVLDVSDAMSHVETISKVITRSEQLRQHGSISLERVRLFLLAVDRVLEIEVSDVDHRQRIRKGISAIRV